MGQIQLKVEQLVLDHDNPRITHAEGQQQALQKIVKDQGTKLVRLAQSVVEHGLSPIDRLMVLEFTRNPKRYVALEGNRRVAALRLLTNPAVMTALDMSEGMKKSIERLAAVFDKSSVEPIECYEVKSRDEGRYWQELRHNGENQGRGTVAWVPIAAARFRKRGPDIQAFDLVIENGGFSEEEIEKIQTGFPLTTLQRLVETPDVRALLGLTLRSGKLYSELPASELIKPLKKIVLDLAKKDGTSRRLNKKEQMVEYVSGFGKADKPDLSKKISERPVEGIQKSEFSRPVKRAKAASVDPTKRTRVVPKGCQLNVTDNRIAEIYSELRTLKLVEARNAIAVLMRVFLELSVDHFLESKKIPLVIPNSKGGGTHDKKLDQKLREAVEVLVTAGAPQKAFAPVLRSLNVPSSPLNSDLLHSYVHNRFSTPSPQELTSGWNNVQGLFEQIWA